MPILELPEIKEYDLPEFRALTIKERLEIYARLTRSQRELIDAHRKYLIKSEFLKDSYLKASDWEFQDLKIDLNYPEKESNQTLLYCECGRRLKYQYIVKSKETGKVMGLGSQHFKDHLKIPQQVATEIVNRLNNVDLALDELLWLKRYGFEFPEELWEVYAFNLYQIQQANTEYEINFSLAHRLVDFKKANMPLYVTDFKAVQQEIEKMSQIGREEDKDSLTEEGFTRFKKSLPSNLKKETLFNQALIWSSQIQKRIETHSEVPVLPKRFFEELFLILKEENEVSRKRHLSYFSNKGMGKWIQKEVYDHLLEKVEEYGLNSSFLDEIHPFMRVGLSPFVETLESSKKLNDEKVKNSVKKITNLLSEFDKEIQREIVKNLSAFIE
ncbi:hypothetical protein [Vagococcus carniphilus]|uniref:hypothetical protein n=1 Tax=Vagococcus carniphilus TaxID=218144 RepID=UPI003BADBCA9